MQPPLEFDSTLRWVGTVGEWSMDGELDNLWLAPRRGLYLFDAYHSSSARTSPYRSWVSDALPQKYVL